MHKHVKIGLFTFGVVSIIIVGFFFISFSYVPKVEAALLESTCTDSDGPIINGIGADKPYKYGYTKGYFGAYNPPKIYKYPDFCSDTPYINNFSIQPSCARYLLEQYCKDSWPTYRVYDSGSANGCCYGVLGFATS
jgi:hypothetical protein